MTGEANSYQIGGDHYRSDYVHWDLVIRAGIGYLEGNATKYFARWRKKNGVEDLKKALHYVEKLLENAHIVALAGRRPIPWVRQEATRFCKANGIDGRERHAFVLLCAWETDADLIVVRSTMAEMVREQEPSLALVPRRVAAVPLEDSNKHAGREDRSCLLGPECSTFEGDTCTEPGCSFSKGS